MPTIAGWEKKKEKYKKTDILRMKEELQISF